MIKVILPFALLFSSFFVSCERTAEPMTVKESTIVLEAGFSSDTRTALNGLSCMWSVGDAIVVNGESSSSVEVLDDGKRARFTLPLIDAPYYAIYPASAYESGSYYPNGGYYGSVRIPDVQKFVSGSFDPDAAIMVGVQENAGSEIAFHHSMAYLKIIINGSSDKHDIASISITANAREALSGSFRFDPSGLSIINDNKDGSSIAVDCGAGVPQGTPVIVAIPAKAYSSGLKIYLKDVRNHFQTVKSTKVFTAEAGKIYDVNLNFVPEGTVIDGQTPGSSGNKVTRILFIGNSHSLDATDLLPIMLRHEGVRNIELTRCYHGGYYLVGYDQNYEKAKNAALSWWSPGQHFWNGSIDLNYSLKDIASTGPFDIIVLQEYSGGEYAWTWNDTEKNSIHSLIGKLRQASPDAEFVYFQSHCWAKGHSTLQSKFNNSNVEQFETVVRENSSHIMDPAEGYPFKRIISTGAMLQSLRTTGLNAVHPDDLCRGDHTHLDYGMPRVAGSLLIWKTLVTPLTGIAPEDVTFRFTEFYPYPERYTTPFIDGNRSAVLAAVNAAYNDPYHITDLSAYTGAPTYTDDPGSVCLDDTGVDVKPVAFPVRFPLANWGGTGCQFLWNPLGIWFSGQPQAYAKWVSVSRPVADLIYARGFNTSGGYSVTLNSIWTGDYFEFVIPVKNFRAGSTVRFSAPFYTRQGPCFWYLDYYDGGEWKHNSSTVSTWDGAFSSDATFAIAYGTTNISADCTFENGIDEGFLRFRLRCADGSIQAASSGAVQRSTPNIASNAYSCAFYFNGDSSLSFSLIK